MPIQISQDSSNMSRRVGRDLSRDMARADRVLANYKDVSLEDIKREFDGKTRDSKGREREKVTGSNEKRKYYQAYMLKKYGESVRDYAEASDQYAEIYGLDEGKNPYMEFAQEVSNASRNGKFPKQLEGKRTANVLFTLVDTGADIITDNNFYTFLNSIKSTDDDFNAFYTQAVSWLTNPDKMKSWRPEDPALSAPEAQEKLNTILSGQITDKKTLESIINSLATKQGDTQSDNRKAREYQYNESDIRYNFSKLSPNEQKEFVRIAKRVGINLNSLGISNA